MHRRSFYYSQRFQLLSEYVFEGVFDLEIFEDRTEAVVPLATTETDKLLKNGKLTRNISLLPAILF